jgi:hypothetical protein
MLERGYFGEGPILAPPRAEAPAPSPAGFVLCPIAFQGGFPPDHEVYEIYRLAYEWAQAALRPCWYERLSRTTGN